MNHHAPYLRGRNIIPSPLGGGLGRGGQRNSPIRELNGKKICILGFGREGQATLRALEKYAPGSSIVIADKNQELGIKKYEYQYGEHYLNNLDRFDVVIKSPGIPPSELLTTNYPSDRVRAGKLLTTPTQIFFDSIADTGALVIGVTGSKGKSTTASLIYAILRAAPHPDPLPKGEGILKKPPLPAGEGWGEGSVYLIGNIGAPALDFLEKAKPGATFIMELSSYQLMDLTVSPQIAIITSFFPEHLDYHASTALSTGGSPLEAYREAKCNICRFQKECDVVFYASRALSPHPALSRPSRASGRPERKSNGRGERVERADGEGTFAIATASPGKRIAYSEEDAPVTLEETHLIGKHNLRNIAGAWKVAEELGIPRGAVIKAIKEFSPLPHRLQSIGIHHGIEWIDDAISTTPESTMAALDALDDRVTTIILGGLDRGYDFHALAKRIAHSQVRTVILLTPKNTDSPPSSTPRIRTALEATHATARIAEACTMEGVVGIAKEETCLPPTPYSLPPVCLLSTASPSYGMFKNFEEKGECFQKAIVP